MSAGMDASVAPAFCHPAFPAGLLRRRQHALLACCLRSLYLLLCLLVFCPAEAGAEGDLPPAPPAPSLSLELEQLDLSGLPGLPPLPAETRPRDKRLRYMAQAQRAVASFQHWLDETSL